MPELSVISSVNKQFADIQVWIHSRIEYQCTRGGQALSFIIISEAEKTKREVGHISLSSAIIPRPALRLGPVVTHDMCLYRSEIVTVHIVPTRDLYEV